MDGLGVGRGDGLERCGQARGIAFPSAFDCFLYHLIRVFGGGKLQMSNCSSTIGHPFCSKSYLFYLFLLLWDGLAVGPGDGLQGCGEAVGVAF